jgi:hypothetical protein
MPRGRPRKTPDNVLIRSAELIGWALGGIEREIVDTKNRLAALTAQANQLRARIGRPGAGRPGRPPAAAEPTDALEPEQSASSEPGTRRKRRRKMSPEARKRMSDMMKKRWAERKKA